METKKCEKSENTLMRRTKKELIEIIFRKDDVEIRLKEDLKNKTEDLEAIKKEINNILDKKRSVICSLDKKLHKTRVTLYWVIAVAVLGIALAVIL